MVRACPPYPSDVYTRGSSALEQSPADPKALVVPVLQARRPVLDESAGVHVHPWPDLGTIHTDLGIYFEVLALLGGEAKKISSYQVQKASRLFPQKSFHFLRCPMPMWWCRHPTPSNATSGLVKEWGPRDTM